MNAEILLLVSSAAAIAFVHTILGPDHYLPFVAMAKARGWSLAKTLRITLVCGAGHLVGSVVLGILGIALGTGIAKLEWVEGIRGDVAGWMLAGFGLAYMVWGLRRSWRNRPHAHWHRHDGTLHYHEHNHQQEHAHVHEKEGQRITPWVIFIIFVLGPCEPLIPLLMYPAATESVLGVVAVTSVFGIVTVLTMLGAVTIASVGLDRFRFKALQRYEHALAGFAIFACGISITLLGL